MWYVVETKKDGWTGEFGPYKDIEECIEHIEYSLAPWTSSSMSKIEMVFRGEYV